MEVSGQLNVPVALPPPPPKKRPMMPILYEAGWTPELVWTVWTDINILLLPGIESYFLGRPARSLAAVPTELSGFHGFV
jgi:hypothetical protein